MEKQATTTLETTRDIVTFDVVLSKDFVTMELSGIVDVLRLANRVLNFEKFKWQFRSENGGRVASSIGAYLETDIIPENPRPDHVVFIGSADPFYLSLDVEKYAARYRHGGSIVILLAEAASRYISSNQDNAILHTTHWENRALLEEEQGIYGIRSSLAVTQDKVITSAGMGATADLTLALLGRHISSAKLMIVSKIILHDRIRAFDTLQPEILATLNTDARILNKAVKIMQENIEEPVTMIDLAKSISRTPRWLERNFKSLTGCSPGRYYRELRLSHAHNLLLNTNMNIQEVALACGYQSGFSVAYRQSFGQTPHQVRRAQIDKM